MSTTEFAEIMNETIVVNAANSVDKYGKRGFVNTGTSYTDCRVMTGIKLIKDAQGREVTETGRVLVLGTATVNIGDKVTLPSGKTPTVIMVNQINDETGVHHTVLHLTEG